MTVLYSWARRRDSIDMDILSQRLKPAGKESLKFNFGQEDRLNNRLLLDFGLFPSIKYVWDKYDLPENYM